MRKLLCIAPHYRPRFSVHFEAAILFTALAALADLHLVHIDVLYVPNSVCTPHCFCWPKAKAMVKSYMGL